jgi:hypothetical protein
MGKMEEKSGEKTVTRYQAENIAIKSLENLGRGFTLEQIAGNAEVRESIEHFGNRYANKPVTEVREAAEELAEKWKTGKGGEEKVVRLEQTNITGDRDILAEPKVVAGAPRETPKAEAERKKKFLAKISEGLPKGEINLDTGEGPDIAELESQVGGSRIAKGGKSALSGPAKGREAGKAAKITPTKPSTGGGSRLAALMKNPPGIGEAKVWLPKGTGRPKPAEKGSEVTVQELEGIINKRIVELPRTFRDMERFLGDYETAVTEFKEGKESGLPIEQPKMKGLATKAANSREKILDLLLELENFRKMCNALGENNPASPALKNAKRTLKQIDKLIERWENA